MVERTRDDGKTASTETQYYISSLPGTGVKAHATAIRSHWSIENDLHWRLDVQMHEDQSRIHKDNGPENYAIIRHIALNLLKAEKTLKVGINSKSKNAGWDLSYLLKVIGF